MKPEQQRIAIAEACGWRYHNDGYYVWLIQPNGDKRLGHGDRAHKEYWNQDIRSLPDYLNDLNAMHEAFASVRIKDRLLYCVLHQTLAGIVAKHNSQHGVGQQDTISTADATAAQRAEAFLRTLNRWVD